MENRVLAKRAGFCGVSRSVARSVRTHVRTRDTLTTQKPSA